MNEHTDLEEKNETIGENLFMKKLLKKRLNQKGLTLIELLAVIVILAIVAAIAIPAIGSLIENSRIKSAKNDALMILSSANLYQTEVGTITSAVDLAALAPYLENNGNFSAASVQNVSGTLTITTATWNDGSNSYTFTGATVDNLTPVTSEVNGPMSDATP